MFKKIIVNVSILFIALLTFALRASAINFDAESIYKSVVVVYSGNALGSGFAIGNSCIITNAHVINDKNDVTVSVYKDKAYSTEILKIDKNLDLAVLKIQSKKLPYLKIANYNDVQIGSDVYAIGAPESLSYTLTKGVLSAKDRLIGEMKYIQIDAPINSGNSGGPLLNDKGEVIGVNTLKLFDSEGIGLAIPMTTVIEFLNDNNIVINQQGDIKGETADNKITNDTQNDVTSDSEKYEMGKLKTQNFYLKIFTVILMFTNFFTIIMIILINRKSKNKPQTPNPEGKDFEIEIQE